MKTKFLRILAALAAPFVLAGGALADNEQYAYDPSQDEPPLLILYSGVDFTGEAREVYDPIFRLPDLEFNDRARSVAVLAGQWEVCEHKDFTGRCVFLRYDVPDLGWFGLSREVSSVRPVMEYTEAEHGLMFVRDENGYIRYIDNEQYGYDTYSYGYGVTTGVQVSHYGYSPEYVRYGYYDPRLGYDPYGFGWRGAGYTYYDTSYYRRERPPLRGHYGARDAAVTLYVDSFDRGPSFGLNRAIPNLQRYRFNDNVSSIQIRSGRWEVCEHANFQGRCEIIDASMDRLGGLRLNDNISSIRPVGGTGRDGWDRHDRGGRYGGWDRGHRDGDRDGRRDGDYRGGRDGDGRRGDGGDGRGDRPRGDLPPALVNAQPDAVTPQPVPRRGGDRTRDRRDTGLAGGAPGRRPAADLGDRARRDPSRLQPVPAPDETTPAVRPRAPAPGPVTRAPEPRRTVPPAVQRVQRDPRDVSQPVRRAGAVPPAVQQQRTTRPATPPPRIAAPEPRRADPPQRVSRPATPPQRAVPSPRPVTPAARPAPTPRPAAPPPRAAPAPRPAPAARPSPPPPPKADPPRRDTRPPAVRNRDKD